MSEEVNKKRKSTMQRIATAVPLVAALVLMLCLGGWVLAVFIMACLSVALYEELNALKNGGYHPVWWPCFAALVGSAPLMMNHSTTAFGSVMMVASLVILFCVMSRREPQLLDAVMSVVPLMTIVLPGMCMFGILDTQPRSFQLYLLFLLFVIPILGDTCAYFVGRAVGGPKLCPQISPNKTISGALGGLLGSMMGALLVGGAFALFARDHAFPPVWVNLLVGLVAGAASQMGDLLASMIKRHCKIKDFGTIFPGHGGMMDRLDSILFSAIILYCFRAIIGG